MRYVVAIAGVLLVIGGLVFIKYSQIAMLIGMGEEMEKAGPPPEPVGTQKAKKESWEGALSAVGTLTSVKGVAVTSEIPGQISKITFESGKTVKAGDVLAELDASVEKAQLVSAQVRWDLANKNVLRSRALTKAGVSTNAQLDTDEAAVRSASADIAVLNAQIQRKIIKAPFDGKLGIRTANVGQYLNPGTPIAWLETVETIYVDFTLPQQVEVKVGMPVKISVALELGPGNGTQPAELAAEGTVEAIDPQVDPIARAVKLRASVPNKDGKLRPGMFAQVSLVLPPREPFIIVPITSVIRASYGDSVFIVEEKEPEGGGEKALFARQQFVKLGESRGDFIAVLDGVKDGEELVSAGAFKLKNNAKVVVDNTVQPTPSLHPKPENR